MEHQREATYPRGFTLIEILVVIGIIGVLLAIFLPLAEKARHRAYIAACANNLRQIGQGIQMYANTNQGQYPRTRFVRGAALTRGTGSASADAFSAASGVVVNDVTAPFWLLARIEHLPAAVFICPYNDETSYQADRADPQVTGNFTDYHRNLGYSYANPYPDAAAESAGYRLTAKLPGDFGVAADLNPGQTGRSDPAVVFVSSVNAVTVRGNSVNHEQHGQNVLYADGHVTFALTPLAGAGGDNIYTNSAGLVEASPRGVKDSVMVPEGDD